MIELTSQGHDSYKYITYVLKGNKRLKNLR